MSNAQPKGNPGGERGGEMHELTPEREAEIRAFYEENGTGESEDVRALLAEIDRLRDAPSKESPGGAVRKALEAVGHWLSDISPDNLPCCFPADAVRAALASIPPAPEPRGGGECENCTCNHPDRCFGTCHYYLMHHGSMENLQRPPCSPPAQPPEPDFQEQARAVCGCLQCLHTDLECAQRTRIATALRDAYTAGGQTGEPVEHAEGCDALYADAEDDMCNCGADARPKPVAWRVVCAESGEVIGLHRTREDLEEDLYGWRMNGRAYRVEPLGVLLDTNASVPPLEPPKKDADA